MMKTKIHIIVSLCLLLLTPSCEDRLVEESFSILSPNNFPNNAEEANSMILGIYDVMRRNESYRWSLFYGMDVMTDDIWVRRSPSRQIEDLAEFIVDPTNTAVGQVYRSHYDWIFRASTTIEALREKEFDGKDGLLGEALMLRALAYFNLVRLYGKVPLIIDSSESLDADQESRAEITEIYDFILADLEEAIPLMPSVGSAELGRPAQGAAKVLLSYVHLTLENWSEAASEAREVINSGEYALLERYRDVHDANTENGVEHMLSVQFGQGSGAGANPHSLFMQFMGPVDWRAGNGASNQGRMRATQDFLDAVEIGDQRGLDMFWTSYENIDGDLVTPDVTLEEESYIAKYRDVSDYVLGTPQGRDDCNFVILRYADALLILAEAENEANGGPTAEAYAAVNEIRNRVGLPNLALGLSQNDFREAVRQERRIEFFFEGKRYFDLQRWGNLVSIISDMTTSTGGLGQILVQNKIDNVSSRHTLWPIPQTALDLNPGLNNEQNEGY